MLLKEGDKLLVAHRRLFERDESRYFIGRVDVYEAGIVKTTGHSYIRDLMSGRLIEKAEVRTKILSLSCGTFLIYQLPDHVTIEALKFVVSDGRLSLTDGIGFTMNLAEFPHGGTA